MTVKKSDGSTRQINDSYYLEWFNNDVYLIRKDKGSNYNSYIDIKDVDDFKEAIKEYDREKARKTIFGSCITNRNFGALKFRDVYHNKCSIQKSSSAIEDCLWIGESDNRMHINQDMAEQIASVLFYFSKYGQLPSYFFDEE